MNPYTFNNKAAKMKRQVCPGSGGRVPITVGQQRQLAGAARPNRASNVRCKVCRREFATARITYTDHGIPTNAQAMIPRHTEGI